MQVSKKCQEKIKQRYNKNQGYQEKKIKHRYKKSSLSRKIEVRYDKNQGYQEKKLSIDITKSNLSRKKLKVGATKPRLLRKIK